MRARSASALRLPRPIFAGLEAVPFTKFGGRTRRMSIAADLSGRVYFHFPNGQLRRAVSAGRGDGGLHRSGDDTTRTHGTCLGPISTAGGPPRRAGRVVPRPPSSGRSALG